MASPINTFKSLAVNVTTSTQFFYTAPADTTTIVLLAQATNVGASTAGITFFVRRSGVDTELVEDFLIPVGDAASLLNGKLVIEPGNSMGVVGTANSILKLTVSFLETR